MRKLYLLLLPLLFTQCQLFKKPEEPTLPAPTQTGANTAGCYMNSLLWLSGNGGFYFKYDSTQAERLEMVVDGTLRNTNSPNVSVQMIVSLADTQVKQLTQLPLLTGKTFSLGSPHKASLYFSQPLEATSGSITFTEARQAKINSVWDYTKQNTFYIVSGTFEFVTSKQKVTKGRFDFSIDESEFRTR